MRIHDFGHRVGTPRCSMGLICTTGCRCTRPGRSGDAAPGCPNIHRPNTVHRRFQPPEQHGRQAEAMAPHRRTGAHRKNLATPGAHIGRADKHLRPLPAGHGSASKSISRSSRRRKGLKSKGLACAGASQGSSGDKAARPAPGVRPTPGCPWHQRPPHSRVRVARASTAPAWQLPAGRRTPPRHRQTHVPAPRHSWPRHWCR